MDPLAWFLQVKHFQCHFVHRTIVVQTGKMESTNHAPQVLIMDPLAWFLEVKHFLMPFRTQNLDYSAQTLPLT